MRMARTQETRTETASPHPKQKRDSECFSQNTRRRVLFLSCGAAVFPEGTKTNTNEKKNQLKLGVFDMVIPLAS